MKAKSGGWKNKGWRSCNDLIRPGLEGVPRYFRCSRDYRLVTHGQVRQFGSCTCGFRKLNPSLGLTWTEIILLKLGWFPLQGWEKDDIRPITSRLGNRFRSYLLRFT